jgi:membrane complex biogenesis BtpA family protein
VTHDELEAKMNVLREIFNVDKPLIAMCHLPALPGRPRYDVAAGMDAVVSSLARDIGALQDAGVDGLLFCNENDIPYQLQVGPEVAAAMAAAVVEVRGDVHVPFGVNILWDAKATLAVAAAVGASFVREVFTGVYESDMGLFAPALGDLAGYRHMIGADDVALFANITPEFSRSVSDRPVADRARGAAYMGVDALLISGVQAGVSADYEDLRAAKEAVTDVPVIANTGVNHDNVLQLLGVADGAIVGTSLKVDGSTWNPIDPDRAKRMVELVRTARVAS